MKNLVLASLIISATALALPAHAEGPYAGVAVTRSSNYSPFVTGTNKTFVSDNSPTGYKLYGGYGLADDWAIEGGYADFGSAKTDYSLGGVAGSGSISARQSADANALFLAAKKSFNLNDAFSLFVKLGASRNHYSMSDTAVGAVGSSSNKTSLYGGLGMAYSLSKNVALTLEAESFGKNGADQNVRTVSAGVRYSF